jgi:hypothetical protein
MSARRRDSRLEVVNAEGVLRVWRDVVGYRTDAGEYLVISSEAQIRGEQLSIYLASGGNEPIRVRVLDSQPTILDGSVRHQLRLAPLECETSGPLEPARVGDLEAE